uniref:Uncharacterized protein n=1 Tax=Arundo donax TaxID=35708 RepID=A0A0A9DQV3_ARUDO
MSRKCYEKYLKLHENWWRATRITEFRVHVLMVLRFCWWSVPKRRQKQQQSLPKRQHIA